MARPIKFKTLSKKNGLVKDLKRDIENYGVIKSTEQIYTDGV
jgi:hypothetical protein